MKKLYCSRDSVSGTWLDPQAFNTDAEAIRSFNWAIASAGMPETFLKDVDLYCVGTFDETNGHVFPSEPVHVINGFNEDAIYYRDYIKGKFEEANDNEIS